MSYIRKFLIDSCLFLELGRFQRKCFNMDLEMGTLDSLKVGHFAKFEGRSHLTI